MEDKDFELFEMEMKALRKRIMELERAKEVIDKKLKELVNQAI